MTEAELSEAAQAVLASPTTWADPPASLEQEVTRAVAAELEKSRRRTGRPWAALPAAAAAVIFVLALASAVAFTAPGAAGARELNLEATSRAPGATAHARISETRGGTYIRLTPAGLPPAPTDTYYEGWVDDPGRGSVSIGTFHLRGGDEPIALWAGVDLNEYTVILVTLEPDDGDPRLSHAVMLRGTIPRVSST